MNVSPASIARIVLLISFGVTASVTASAVVPTLFSLPEPRPGCDTPVRWSLGDVDPRFPLGRKDFLSTVFQAEAVWESAIGRDLFLYDPSASFVVTTLFDERQMMTYDNRELESRLERYEETSASLSTDYEALRAVYERDSAILRTRIAEFERDLRVYNRTVAKVNATGGADEDLFEELEDEKDDLADEEERINDEIGRLDDLAAEMNDLADRLNTETHSVNERIRSFQEAYGDPRPFVQGLYDPEDGSITVYQFEETEDLRLVLAHEFGHALGIDEHVEEDPTAVMYFLMEKQDVDSPALSPGDMLAYGQACPPRIPSARERLVRYLVSTPLGEFRLSEAFALLSGTGNVSAENLSPSEAS